MFSLFRYFAFVISLCPLRYFVMSPSLFRLFVFSLSSFRLFAFVFSSFRYGAFVMSPRNNEKTKWHKSATIGIVVVFVSVVASDCVQEKKVEIFLGAHANPTIDPNTILVYILVLVSSVPKLEKQDRWINDRGNSKLLVHILGKSFDSARSRNSILFQITKKHFCIYASTDIINMKYLIFRKYWKAIQNISKTNKHTKGKLMMHSNMTWLFSPIKSTDTNPGIVDFNRTHHGKAWLAAVAVVTCLFGESPFRESAFRESVLSSVF